MLYQAGSEDFPEIWELMDCSFPPAEHRLREKQLELLLNRPAYSVLIRRQEKKGPLEGFLAYWTFQSGRFIEHFAVSPQARGGGIGGEMLRQFLQMADTSVFLEVEPPQNELTRRRIAFYQRVGFHLNDFPYTQPSMQPDQPPVPLRIMSWPEPVSGETFALRKEDFLSAVYNVKDSSQKTS